MKIEKRDGSIQEFNLGKIREAIRSAMNATGTEADLTKMLYSIEQRCKNSTNLHVEMVQDFVEEELMRAGHLRTAKAYILYRAERAKVRNQREHPDPDALSDYIHASKYARWSGERRETFEETVDRVIGMHKKKYGDHPYLRFNDIREAILQKKILPSMRSMQFAGPAIEQENARMFNCSFTLCNRPSVFGEIFYLLLCGCGVGFSVLPEFVAELPPLEKVTSRRVRHLSIADTIAGWAGSIDALFRGFTEGVYVEFDYSKIRPEGAPLITSGGSAPGHIPLKSMLEQVRSYLSRIQGRKMRPIEVHDVICMIASAVLSGGVRRSSLISLFDPEDEEMFYAKAPENFEYGGKNEWRQNANNSAVLDPSRTEREDFDRILSESKRGFGEPGFFFTHIREVGTNPCGEIRLNPVYNRDVGFAFCNLCEINIATVEDDADFLDRCRLAAILGTMQSGYTEFKYLSYTTTLIAKHRPLLGVSLTGLQDNPGFWRGRGILERGREAVYETNHEMSAALGLAAAQFCTCVKPSGTASLVLKLCFRHPIRIIVARFFRRVTANPNEGPAQVFRQFNPHMVEEKPNGDWCITFPVEIGDHATTVKEQSAKEFLEDVFFVYEEWIGGGHNVSATVTLREDEDVTGMIWDHRHSIGALSFAPYLLDKKVPYAPREEVTPDLEAKWESILKHYAPVPWDRVKMSDVSFLPNACEGGTCEL